eukprot:TRINITY_DN3141_c0_g1_i4.p1 TRINITY_DN3141_c0_g1~~TRINITY_DN3141_c0_g1_i4.p1  ORF type:complete len:292 (-),score=72.91 TRINITY_DN3141_c0_g1_i4:511-1386(-)
MLNVLPRDLFYEIAGFLEAPDLGVLNLLDRTCHYLLTDDAFWQKRANRDFGLTIIKGSWKVQYQTCYEQRVIPMLVTTAIRFRPISSREASESMAKLESIINDQSYSIDHYFDSNSDQGEVFSSICLPLVKGLLNGINGAMYAWGPNGSGKTHTIFGSDGMLHRSLQHIFDQETEMHIQMSFITIYNERIEDLLKKPLDHDEDYLIREVDGATYIENLVKKQVFNLNDALFNLKTGQETWNRDVTIMSICSSKCWSIVTLWMEHHVIVPMGKKIYSARLDFVDCAAKPSSS